MNRRMIIFTLGQLMVIGAALLMVPVIVSVIYGEYTQMLYYSLVAVFSAVLGVAMGALSKPKTRDIYAKDGFIIVALAWLLLSVLGALPMTLSGESPSFVDSFFEIVSGFTTTGASVIPEPALLSRSTLLWRSFTHWVGGMGILVLCMAVVPSLSARSIHIMRAEMPGPIVGKLVPRAKDTAKLLYIIYIALTLIMMVLLLIGGMPLYESIIYSVGTAGTGGFATTSGSCAGSAPYMTPYIQWVITAFMFVFGVNFNLYYLLLRRKGKSVLKSDELWVYLGLIVAATIAVSVNIYPIYGSLGDTVRHSSFQIGTVMSTTGYSTADFNLWPTFSKTVLLLLMFTGACAGSTAGGLKISRAILLVKMAKSNLRKMIHPRTVSNVRLETRTVNDDTQKGVANYFAVYMFIIAAVFLILSFDGFDIETNLSATIACFNNIGPGLGAVGPASNYSAYSDISKIVLSFAMLMGRLEIYPLLFLFAPSTWTKK